MYAYIVWDGISNDGHLCSALCHKGALWIYFYILKPIWRLSQLLRSLNFRHLLERHKSKHRKPTVVFKLPDQKLGCLPACFCELKNRAANWKTQLLAFFLKPLRS